MADTPATETKLLIHSDTTDGSTIFVDSSNSEHVLTPSTPEHDTDQAYFGATSILFPGNGEISAPDSDDWDFGADDWTIDMWIRPTSFSVRQAIINQSNTGASSVSFWVEQNAGGTIRFLTNSGNTLEFSTTGSLTVLTWQHLAIVRSGNTVTVYFDGVADATTGDATGITFGTLAEILRIGRYSGGFFYDGHIDEIRILKGIAAWTANFTPPTTPYSVPDAPSVSGIVTEESVPVARTVRAYDRSTGVFIAGTTSSAVDGSYSIETSVYTEVFVVAFDDVAGTVYNAVILDKITPS